MSIYVSSLGHRCVQWGCSHALLCMDNFMGLFPPSIFVWILGIYVKIARFHDTYFYQLNQITSTRLPIISFSVWYSQDQHLFLACLCNHIVHSTSRHVLHSTQQTSIYGFVLGTVYLQETLRNMSESQRLTQLLKERHDHILHGERKSYQNFFWGSSICRLICMPH